MKSTVVARSCTLRTIGMSLGAGCVGVAAVVASALLGSCNASYELAASTDGGSLDAGAVAFGPIGATIPIYVTSNSTPPGVAVAFSALPSTITVSPTSATIDQTGVAITYALVPYGVQGTVVATAPFANSTSTSVSAAPLTLCTPQFAPISGSGSNPTGQSYSISIPILTSGTCGGGTPAPSGVPVSITLTQQTSASSASSTTSVLTNDQGVATIGTLVPWGASVLVQATAGGGFVSSSTNGVANPASIPCMYWSAQGSGVYQLSARVVEGQSPDTATTVAFSVIFPAANAATITPASPVTNDAGVATSFVVVPDAGSLPVIVEAVAGASALTTTITSGDAGDSGVCN